MRGVVLSVVATKLADYLVDPTLQQLQYLFCVGKIITNVEEKKKELIFKQGKVQKRVDEAIGNPERSDDEVDDWKNESVSLIAEVESLVQQLRANSDCFHRWCPIWRRYRLCKMLAKTSQRMTELNTRGDKLEHIVHDIEYHSSKNFMFFKSTELAFGELLEALQDDDSSIIGLWGMGGSGKTSLVKQVGKKAKELKLFDRVIITTVSQIPNIWNIQGQIADLLGLELEQEIEVERARKIALRLQSPKERILIILDDVWAMLNLEDIGNPFGDEGSRNCKVLLTTRLQDICTLMGCQKSIRLDLLKEDEAWNLFQAHAVVDDAAKEVVARAIAMECKGLPIAIVAVGSCLKGKGTDEIDVMLYKLKNAKPIINEVSVNNAFSCLELSYNYLPTSEAKLLLLMCAMFPEDHNIAVESIFKYAVGLGLCLDADSFEIERSHVRATIEILVDSSLLTHSLQFNMQGQDYVMMHDVVRDFALWEASKEDHTIMVNCTKELDELIVDEKVKDCYAISSWYDNNKKLQFPSQLNAPKLEFLLLRSRNPLDVSHASFEGTKGLKALIIMCTNMGKIKLQPQSIQHLSTLRVLRLQRWDLRDISFVVSLKELEILDLQGSRFEKMPNGIENLNKLKLLDLTYCTIDECCCEVIGRCLQLEELYVSMHFPHSKNENCYKYLVGPTALKKLRRYKIEIGEGSRGVVFQNEGIRSLHLGQLDISMLGAIIKDLAQRAIAIQFYELEEGSKCFTPNIVQAVGGMNELTKLCLERCSNIECITDETTPHEDAVLQTLDELEIQDMGNLKQLCLGPSPFSLFQKLERLGISNCPQLLHIFPADCNLGNLKFLEIYNCPMLESIFPISTACNLLSLEELQIRHCNELKHVLAGEGSVDAWGNSRLPKLKMLYVNDCFKLEYVFPVFLVQNFEQLQHLYLENAPKMKFVFGEEQQMHDPDETQIVLPPLEYLHLQNLPNLVGICSKKYCLRQSTLKTIACSNCPNMFGNLQLV